MQAAKTAAHSITAMPRTSHAVCLHLFSFIFSSDKSRCIGFYTEHALYQLPKIVVQRSRQAILGSVGICKFKPSGVQRLSRNAGVCLPSVESIAHYRESYTGKMHSQLMRPPGQRINPQKIVRRIRRYYLKTRFRTAAAFVPQALVKPDPRS